MNHDDRAGLDGLVERIKASRRRSFLLTCAGLAIGLAAIGFVAYHSYGLVQTVQQHSDAQLVASFAPVAQSLGVQVDPGDPPSQSEFVNLIAGQAVKLKAGSEQANNLVASANDAKAAAEREANNSRTQLASVNSRLATANADRERAVAESQLAAEQLVAVTNEKEQATSERRAAEDKLATLTASFETQNAELNDLAKKLSNAEREIAAKEQQISELMSQLNNPIQPQADKELRECRTKLDAAEQRAARSNTLAKQNGRKYDQCYGDLEKLRAAQGETGDLSRCVRRVESLEGKLSSCFDTNNKLKNAYSRLKQKCGNPVRDHRAPKGELKVE